MAAPEKLVIVTRRTALEELVERFNTRDQARFYIEHMGGRFDDYQAAHDAYRQAVSYLRANLPRGVRCHWIDRSFLPTYTFGESDLVVILGQDGLVVNAAKYLSGQAVVALNPDPSRIDGILLPFAYPDAARAIASAMSDSPCWRRSRWPRQPSTTARPCWQSTIYSSVRKRTPRPGTGSGSEAGRRISRPAESLSRPELARPVGIARS